MGEISDSYYLPVKEDSFITYAIAKEDVMEEFRYLTNISQYSPSLKRANIYKLNEGLSKLFQLENHVLLKLETKVSRVEVEVKNG